ncbi:MAG: hypothetical protein K6G50_13965 [bacterium]|nr:hypothetical protein [bacterium]
MKQFQLPVNMAVCSCGKGGTVYSGNVQASSLRGSFSSIKAYVPPGAVVSVPWAGIASSALPQGFDAAFHAQAAVVSPPGGLQLGSADIITTVCATATEGSAAATAALDSENDEANTYTFELPFSAGLNYGDTFSRSGYPSGTITAVSHSLSSSKASTSVTVSVSGNAKY